MNRRYAQRHTPFFHSFKRRLCSLHRLAALNKLSHIRICCSRLLRQRMLGSNSHVGNAHQSIRTRRVHAQLLFFILHIERKLDTLGSPDPVTLHRLNGVRPAVQPIQVIQQLICIGSDFHKPLRNLTTLDQRIGSPASAINYLFVGQYGLVNRVPVNNRILAIDETLGK